MKSIKVVDLLGTPCLLAPELGQSLAARIKDSLGLFSSSVKVDFEGYQFLSSAFLNHAFGQICIDEDWDTPKFEKKVSVVGLQEDDLDEMRLAVDNAQARRNMIRQGISPETYYSAHLGA